jgi:acid phosphatase
MSGSEAVEALRDVEDDMKKGKKGKKPKGQDYVRAVVNGKMEVMTGCEDGLEGSCKWETFEKWVDERIERWSDWASVCEKKE